MYRKERKVVYNFLRVYHQKELSLLSEDIIQEDQEEDS
jgi:hypothetical protein